MPIDSVFGSSAMPMRSLQIILAIVATACLAGAVTQSQGVVRVRVSSQAESPQPAQPGRPAQGSGVEAIEPTPEQRAQVADLIDQLGAPRLVVRDRAMSDLAQFGAVALGQVRDATQHDDDEIAWRCVLLEEVILSGQGELFLSARSLGLSISELNAHLGSEDMSPLLNVLRTRAEPGMAALWARIMHRSINQPRLFLVAKICRDVEGGKGYGQALTRAATQIGPGSASLLRAAVLLPPGDASDCVELLTQVRFAAPNDELLGQVLDTARGLRGAYSAADALAARHGSPPPNAQDAPGAATFRQQMALTLTDTCTLQDLAQAGLPPVAEMPPALLDAWMGLLGRSNLLDRAREDLLALLQADAGQRVAIAAGHYAAAAAPADVISLFESLPLAAQLAVLDAWWLDPREPQTLHPFLLTLLQADAPAVARAAVGVLAQFRSPGSALALQRAAMRDGVAVEALRALLPMADLLSQEGVQALIAAYPQAPAPTRPLLAAVLAASEDGQARETLLRHWRDDLPRAELDVAMRLLGRDTNTPAGAWNAARQAEAAGPQIARVSSDVERISQMTDSRDRELIRALIGMDTEQGFELLQSFADTPDDPNRLPAMAALALAGRDGALVADWIRRFNGEVPDPQQAMLGLPLALSASPEAARLREQTLQQGLSSPNLRWLLYSFTQSRCPEIEPKQLLAIALDSPEGARAHWQIAINRSEGVSARAARNIAAALLFSRGGQLSSSVHALWLHQSGMDVLDVLFSGADGAVPRNAGQLIVTALLGEAQRAREIIERTQADEDGSLWAAERQTRAWLGMLSEAENARLTAGFAADAAGVPGAVMAARGADAGDARALRALLDTHGPLSRRFDRAVTGSAKISDTRWGSSSLSLSGAARMLHPADRSATMPASILRAWLPEAPEDWGAWWHCRRALLHWDGVEFQFMELP